MHFVDPEITWLDNAPPLFVILGAIWKLWRRMDRLDVQMSEIQGKLDVIIRYPYQRGDTHAPTP